MSVVRGMSDVADIQPLQAEHVDGLAACHIACWRESYRGLVPDHLLDAFDVERRARQWERIRQSGAIVVVAVENTTVIGFAAATESELTGMYVREAFHGTGIADRLLDAAFGVRPASLWVFDANPRAQAFYRRHGFGLDGTRAIEPFSGVPEVRMRRDRVPE